MENNTSFDREVEERISKMESDDYVFPEVFSKADWIAAAIVIVLSGISIVLGIRL